MEKGMTVTAPGSVKRGENIHISGMVKPDSLGGARQVELIFENKIYYHKSIPILTIGERRNYSNFIYSRIFSLGEVRSLSGNLEAEFTLGIEVPPTYKGTHIESKWVAKLKVDIPLFPDRNVIRKVIVER